MKYIITGVGLFLLSYLIFAFVQAEINPFVWSWEIRGHMTFAWFLAFGGYVLYCILKEKDL